MSTGEIKWCEENTNHRQLGNSGRCYCGFKKYPLKCPTGKTFNKDTPSQIRVRCQLEEGHEGEHQFSIDNNQKLETKEDWQNLKTALGDLEEKK